MTSPQMPRLRNSAPGIRGFNRRFQRTAHYCTIFRPENVFTSLATPEEMRDLTGLEFTELVTFQPRRAGPP